MSIEGEKAPNQNPGRRALTLNVPGATHETMTRMAREEGIPVTKLLRKAYGAFENLDTVATNNPTAFIELFDGGPKLSLSIFTQLGKDAC